MRFEQQLLEGTLLRRTKRFLADVKLRSGEEVTVHCANSGGMEGVTEPGNKVLISVSEDPRRRWKHQLEIIYTGRTAVGIHSGRTSSVVAEAIAQSKIANLAGYATLRRDVKYDRDHRIDILLEGNGLRPCYISVQNVALATGDVAIFPDTQHDEGAVLMERLTDLVREGNRAMVFFVAQRMDVKKLTLAESMDPEFVQAFRDAIARGVEQIAFRAEVQKKGIELDDALEILATP